MKRTIISLFTGSVEKFAENPFLWEKKYDEKTNAECYVAATYKSVHENVRKFAAGLMSIGIEKNDRIALISEGRNNWIIAELGILFIGAINVPLSIKLEAADIKFRIQHSGCKAIIVSRNQAEKIQIIRESLAGDIILIYLDENESLENNEFHFDELLKKGEVFLQNNKQKLDERTSSVAENDFANICYTSGTTADPKGIVLSHLNYFANVEQAISLMNIPENYKTLLILPLDHAFAHTAGIYCFMKMGASIGTVKIGKTPAETLRNIPINIKEFKPNLLMSVPALAKNFRKNIEKGIRDKGKIIENLFNTGLKIAYTYNLEGWNKGKACRIFLKPFVMFFDNLIFKKIRENFGGNLDFFIGGGALLDIELQRFFYAIGIPMYQGYGLTEASPIISSNAPQKHKLGSSGFIVNNLEVKICDEKGNELPFGEKGEIVIRGENVMVGYWNNEKATQDSIKDNYLFTGDMGFIDNDGFLYVIGRFKNLLIGDDGEKYSPEGIEETITEKSPFIEQIMLYNNQNPYTVALLVPNAEAIKRFCNQHHIDYQSHEGLVQILNLLKDEINSFKIGNKNETDFPERWLPSTYGIPDEAFSEKNQFINSTLKMVRGKITAHYQATLDFLYSAQGKNIANDENVKQLKKYFKQ